MNTFLSLSLCTHTYTHNAQADIFVYIYTQMYLYLHACLSTDIFILKDMNTDICLRLYLYWYLYLYLHLSLCIHAYTLYSNPIPQDYYFSHFFSFFVTSFSNRKKTILNSFDIFICSVLLYTLVSRLLIYIPIRNTDSD